VRSGWRRRGQRGTDPLASNPDEVESALGYRFRDRARLAEALTHSSVLGGRSSRARTYERLEFLGDRVLGLIVAHLLIERFPEDAEGDLTQRQVAMVRQESLAEVAGGLGLGRWIRTAPSEAATAAGHRPAMLADCCEAVIGAIYLDGGFAAAQTFVTRLWAPMIETVQTPPRDAKMALQEWAHARSLAPPVYRVVATAGPDHAMTFTVEVALADRPPQTASAGTKRAAERAAASQMLQRIAEDGHERA
jgi:ribonuclease-3